MTDTINPASLAMYGGVATPASVAAYGDPYATGTTANANWLAANPAAANAPLASKSLVGVGTTPTVTPSSAAASTPASTGYSVTQQPAAVQAQTATRTINPATETTQGQLSGIIAANSPLMQQAQAQAKQAMNDRGLGDSSLAVGAAQGALYSAAEPIAASDANTYSTASSQNMQAQNTSNITNATAQNQVNAANANALNAEGSFAAGAQNQAGLVGAQLASQQAIAAASNATQLESTGLTTASQQAIAAANNASSQAITQMNNTTQLQVQQLTAANQQLLQTDASAAQLHSTSMQTIAAIEQNVNLSDSQKTAAVADQMTSLNNALSILQLAKTTLNPGS